MSARSSGTRWPLAQRVQTSPRNAGDALAARRGGSMATMGPEDRERFARGEERTGVPSFRREPEPERQRSIKVVAGGSITEAICGAATAVLAIIGLTGTMPGYMASVATIAFGVALVAQGGAVAARHSHLLREATPLEWGAHTEVGGGIGAEMLAGGAGVVLGILGLLGIGTGTLIPIAVIVFGGALLLGSSAGVDVGGVAAGGPGSTFAHVAHQATVAASGGQVLLGIAAIVLGIIALVGFDPLLITLVALLVVGASVLLSGAAVSSRMASVLRRA
jgi:hypothetical protein